MSIRSFINYIVQKLSVVFGTSHLVNISSEMQRVREIVENLSIDTYLSQHLYQNPKYVNTRRVTHFHRSVFAQNGEDGIINEIFSRIGLTNNTFVEFGVHGIKNNSTFLLVKGWKGLWIGAPNELSERLISAKFRDVLQSGRLQFHREWIMRENIEVIIRNANIPSKFDFLSIDLDGNDYWIWDAIVTFRPRVVCIEYNSVFPPDVSWIMEYNDKHKWDQTNYFGASLKALEKLGAKKGYRLVGCDFSGCNAFFIDETEDLSLFAEPFTAEHHYESPRYFLRKASGHPPGFGPFVIMP